MTRSPAVVVRDITVDDCSAVLQMWGELRDMGGRIERMIPDPDQAGLCDRIAAIDADPSARGLVAVVDDEVVGMVLLTSSTYAPLLEPRALHAHYLHVKDGFRRRGVGKALLAASLAYAEEVGAEHVMTSVLPQMRDTQRFYARLGFGPVVVRRSVPVALLRRRLQPSSSASVTDSLLARRRSLRRVRAAVARVGD